ncbi:MAG: RNase adapter RapZ, partial [Desulfoplanes sp.]
RPFSGKDLDVAQYVLKEPFAQEFVTKLQDFLAFLLPLYAQEGRYRLTIALGCTGGRHRSVAIAELIFRFLRQKAFSVSLEHRHLERD